MIHYPWWYIFQYIVSNATSRILFPIVYESMRHLTKQRGQCSIAFKIKWEIASLNKYFHFSYFITQLYASYFSNYYIMAIHLSSQTFFIDKNIFTFLIRQSCLYKHSRLSIKYFRRQSSRVTVYLFWGVFLRSLL